MPEPTARPVDAEAFRAAFDAAVPGICVEQDFVIRYANAACARIFGAPDAEALLGQDVRTLAAPEDRGRVEEQALGALRGGPGPERFDFRGRRRDGAVIWLDATAAVARWAEAPAIVRTLLDVTTSRRLQEQLVRTQKIEAVGRLAGGVAHDFNNLLTVILGRAEMLLQRPAGAAGAAEARRDVELIYKTASQGTTLIQQLMAFAQRDAVEAQPVSVNDVVERLAPMLRQLIPEHVEMRLALAPALGPVSADPSQLEQVAVNLVVNARDAMPTGGVVTIETGEVTLGAPEAAVRPGISPGAYVTLTVRDGGAGMDAATRQRVFEPFFTTKPAGKGAGLGLATVYAIVRQSGGWIDVESEPGQGSVFRIFLPRVTGSAAPARAPRVRAAAGGGMILVVEDDEGVRLMAADALRMFGHTVLDAADPDEALTLAAEQVDAIDLIVTDVVMPHMSGPALVERLHLAHPTARVLYISGYGEDLEVLRGLLARGVPFLQKPFTVSALSSAVTRMLEADEGRPS